MLSNHALRRVTLALLFVAALGQRALAEEAKTAELPKPGVVSFRVSPLATSRPSAEFANLREQMLSEHMRPTPLAEASEAPVIQAPPDPATATSLGIEDVEVIWRRPFADDETAASTSTVLEMSVAGVNEFMLATGNWFASLSKDGGQSFSFLNPSTAFPSPAGMPFCCDQVALADPRSGTIYWLLQYIKGSGGNVLRLAVANRTELQDGTWRYYDFTPSGVGNWSFEWFDFPDLAQTVDHLFITTNMFSTLSDTFTRSVVMRLSKSSLEGRGAQQFAYFDDTERGSYRCVQGAGATMFAAAHKSPDALLCARWDDASATYTTHTVAVPRWKRDGHSSIGPDGRDCLKRCDGRITAAWMAQGRVGFGWSAAADGNFPQAFVRAALIDPATVRLTATSNLWNPGHAFAYPSAGLNSAGEMGLGVFYGGSTTDLSFAVGLLDADAGGGSWKLTPGVYGKFGPVQGTWGDYGAVQPFPSVAGAWLAPGWVLGKGPTGADMEPHLIAFRRRGPVLPAAMEAPKEDVLPALKRERDRLRPILENLEKRIKELGG